MIEQILISVLSVIQSFLNSSFFPLLIAIISLGFFVVYYYRANREVNKHRKEVQQQLINKATIVLPRREYDVACAGSNNHSSCSKVESIDIEACNFCDKKGNLLNVSKYDCFVVHGNSMKYAGINDQDFIFVQKDFSLSSIDNEALPLILVIKYREIEEGKAKYKVRRTWYRGTIDDNFDQVLSRVMSSDDFSKLKKERGYITDDWMLKDFMEKRLEGYKNVYYQDGQCPEAYKDIIISTTYDTENDEIHFSIHPSSAIVGIVSESYTVINK